MRAWTIACAVAACGVVACATLAGGGGGGDDLPNRGVLGYDKVELDDDGDPETSGVPYVMTPDDPLREELLEPSAVTEGGRVVLYYGWHVRERTEGGEVVEPEVWQIRRARAAGTEGVAFEAPQTVLDSAALPEWAAGRVAAPSVIRAAAGGWLMAFEAGAGEAIGLARSGDGLTWTVEPEPLLKAKGDEATVGAPSIVEGAAGLEVFYAVTTGEGARVIARARVDAEEGLVRAGIVLAPPVTDCVDAFGEPDTCWDAEAVWSPEVRLATTPTGRRIYRMTYSGTTKTRGDVGFAASDDGQTWQRLEFNPLLGDNVDEAESTNVLLSERYLVYFVQRDSAKEHGIALAINDDGAPSEVF